MKVDYFKNLGMSKPLGFFEKKYHYRILHEEKLIVEYYSGDIVLENLIEFKKILLTDPEYNPQYNLLIDLRDATFLLTEYEIKKYLEYAKPVLYLFKKRKSAYLTHTPNQVVFVTFIEYYSEGFLPIEVKIFSTTNAAISWLKHSIYNSDVLENELIDLKNTN